MKNKIKAWLDKHLTNKFVAGLFIGAIALLFAGMIQNGEASVPDILLLIIDLIYAIYFLLEDD